MTRVLLLATALAAAVATAAPDGVSSHGGVRDKGPTWSPDGTSIAFTRAGNDFDEIWITRADGTGHRKVTRGTERETQPAWSPDGRRIAFTARLATSWDIYVMDVDGSNRVRVTTHPSDDTAPAWSPDGTRIVYHRGEETRESSEIRVVGADGSGDRALTTGARNESPSWSPDGTRIVFQSTRDGSTRVDWDLYTMNADGSDVTRLTNTPGRREDQPAWAPDGSRIAFSAGGDVARDIYVSDADGSNERRVTHLARPVWAPRWSPDGTSIAFFEFPFPRATIYLVRADGSGLTPLFGSLRFAGFTLTPRRPVPGRTFAAVLRVSGSGDSVRVACRATIRARTLRVARTAFASGRARCAWILPPGAKGARLVGSVVATERGSRVDRRFSVRVR